MKTLKVLLVLLVLCFTLVGVTSISTTSTYNEDVKTINDSEVIKLADLKRSKLKKPSNS